MMSLLVMILALIAAVLGEAIWPAWVWLGQARPPLVMGVVLYYAWNRSPGLMLAAAGLGGVLSDSLNSMPLGYATLCLAVFGLWSRAGRDTVFSQRWIMHLAYGAAAGAGMILALYGLAWMTDPEARALPLGRVFLKAFGAGVYGAALTPALFRVMEQADRMVGNLRGEAAA